MQLLMEESGVQLLLGVLLHGRIGCGAAEHLRQLDDCGVVKTRQWKTRKRPERIRSLLLHFVVGQSELESEIKVRRLIVIVVVQWGVIEQGVEVETGALRRLRRLNILRIIECMLKSTYTLWTFCGHLARTGCG